MQPAGLAGIEKLDSISFPLAAELAAPLLFSRGPEMVSTAVLSSGHLLTATQTVTALAPFEI